MCGHNRACGQVHDHGCVSVCVHVCVCVCMCMSKRAQLRCIHMGICAYMCTCTGAFTWEWGGPALEA